jgi:hypothetical protein
VGGLVGIYFFIAILNFKTKLFLNFFLVAQYFVQFC